MNANSPPHTQGLDSTVSVFGYLCLCLNVFFFSALLAADQQAFNVLCREDYWVESLTAVWFFLAGLLLFVTARRNGASCGAASIFSAAWRWSLPPAKKSVGDSVSSGLPRPIS